MKEIEVKVLEIDPKEVVAKLKQLGAEKIEAGLVKVKAYDFPDGRLKKDRSFVRLRTFGHRHELMLKKMISKQEYKIAEEIETAVSDHDATVKLVESLGMETFSENEKYRASYRLGNARVEFDKLPTAPWFIEIEAPTEADVEKAVDMLGFSMSDTTSEGGWDVMKRYGLSRNFTFAEKGESPDYDKLFQ
jgi:adenylate cyclase class 2